MDYKEKVYSLLRKVPKGKVMTYKSIASALGMHPRAVAVALRMNTNPVKIPCYKVVHADGKIGGYSGNGGIKRKIELLENDGIKIEDGRVESEFII